MAPSKGRILCTEDDADTRDLIVFVLSEEGYQVQCTDNPDEAISLAKEQHFDLFLVDNWLPGLSGTDLTEKLRKFDIRTPILFYSGAAYESDKEAALSAGAQGYLVKPVPPVVLVKEVARLIGEAKAGKPLKVVLP
jgi:DNA-binding response OmpR family regulator